jgi:hypothetical protein
MPANSGLSGEDYAEIQNLYAYYNLCSDAGDAEGYASCFTPDGVLMSGQSFRVQGRADFVAFKKKDVAGRGGRYRRHWNGSIHLEKIGPDTVRGRCYLSAYNGVPGSLPELADVGVYEDKVVRTAEGWRFAERKLAFDATSFKPPA